VDLDSTPHYANLKKKSRALTQAVSRWLPNVVVQVCIWQHVGFMVDKAALGQVFSAYFSFPCQSSFHQFLHLHNHPGMAQ
jgi:hypothetical protein